MNVSDSQQGEAVFPQDGSEVLSDRDVDRALRAVIHATRHIPIYEMSAEERMTRAGFTFAEAPVFIRYTAESVKAQPELFAGLPIDPDLVLARQQRTFALWALSGLFRELADSTANLALCDLSDATHECMELIKIVRTEAAMPHTGQKAGRRIDALAAPLRVLADRQEHKVRVAKRADLADRKTEAELHGVPLRPPIQQKDRRKKEFSGAYRIYSSTGSFYHGMLGGKATPYKGPPPAGGGGGGPSRPDAGTDASPDANHRAGDAPASNIATRHEVKEPHPVCSGAAFVSTTDVAGDQLRAGHNEQRQGELSQVRRR